MLITHGVVQNHCSEERGTQVRESTLQIMLLGVCARLADTATLSLLHVMSLACKQLSAVIRRLAELVLLEDQWCMAGDLGTARAAGHS